MMPSRSDGNAAKRLADTSPGPWKTWRKMSRHARAIKFIETYCTPVKGIGHGKPLKLGVFQKEFLEDALADGTSSAILGTPRGNGKSSGGGAFATWALFDDDMTGQPQVPIIATTVGQAIRSCYGVAISMIRKNPELNNRALIYTGTGSRVVVPSNEWGEMFPIANDTEGLQGLDPSIGIVDEIGFQPQDSWDSLQLAQGKRERSVILGLGTPGLDHENALYYLRGLVRSGQDVSGLVYHEYSAHEGCRIDDRDEWRVANPALVEGFLSEAAIEASLRITPEPRFRVFRLGQWIEVALEGWLGEDGPRLWEGLVSPFDFADGSPIWVGVDMGIKHDSTAVVWVGRRANGKLHAKARIWMPSPNLAVDTTDVMKFLRTLSELYDVRAVSYDPRFFEVPAAYLTDEGLPMIDVPQSTERMTSAIGHLYELVTTKELTHDGDPAFTAQVLAASPRYNDRGFTLSKPKSRGRIDAAIALALATDRAEAEAMNPKRDEVLVAWR